ncbi:5-oxoprolinase subunit PxpA [Croceivirga thetidis]|uniref:5-oxoprolinase subunit PxpA n=1 Tax=Croceivirga thetidis TaxID=2721623 RepID=A0ABX1GTS8_9FLAO|nr:5-oxoprolinase subunit PxpA [Croceivirga thetidis]NKI32456.1 5-oxoprolinase subunit PxpA [Croceivirga thetidis]
MGFKLIDINCDVGEGVGNEEQLLPLISSCNIACGGHAGDEKIIRNTIGLAISNGVKIGAHPSYPDKENFGRKVLDISSKDLVESIKNQMNLFSSLLQKERGSLHHIKAHGALYNQIAKDDILAGVFLQAIDSYKSNCRLYVPFNSKVAKLAKKLNFTIVYEAFGDRNYNADLSLVSRTNENALIQEPKLVLEHIKRMVIKGVVRTVGGVDKPIISETYCIHGDTPSAFKILTYLQRELPNYKLKIA